jgi:hypothetical protein
MFHYKQQHEALGSWAEALLKEKKEKENVLTYLELMNVKNVCLFNFKELKRRTTKVEKKSWWRQIKTMKGIYNSCKHSWRL